MSTSENAEVAIITEPHTDLILGAITDLANHIYDKARADLQGESEATNLPPNFHLGYSRIAKYQECPRQYYYSYVEGIRMPGSTAMRRGTAYHSVVERLLNHKMTNHGDLLSGDLADKIAIHEAKKETLTDSEIYRVIDATRFYYSALYPLHKPIAVEESFEITRGGVPLTGRIDLIDEDGWVIDHKFSYDTWSEQRAKFGCQPMVYQWAALDVYEKMFPGWKFKGFQYNIIRLFPSPKIQRITIHKLDQAASDWWEKEVAGIASGIAQEQFRATPNEKSCKWCSYKDMCLPVIYNIDTEMLVDSSSWGEEDGK